MSENNPDGAVARIERACARIEAAARKANGDRATIAARHRTLRAEIRDTIGLLDAMIADSDDNTDEALAETTADHEEEEPSLWQR